MDKFPKMTDDQIVARIKQLESTLLMRERTKRFERVATLKWELLDLDKEIKVLNEYLVKEDEEIEQLTTLYKMHNLGEEP